MILSRWFILVGLALVPTAQAQQISPRIGYVYPAGGQQGTVVQVVIGGRALSGASALSVSGSGIQAKVLAYSRPPTPREFKDLREKLRKLAEGPRDAAAMKEIAEIKQKLIAYSRNANPTLAETVTIEASVAADAQPGAREIRLRTAQGLSNPLAFHVGQLAEVNKKDASYFAASPGRKPSRIFQQTSAASPYPEMSLTLPATVNGQILPGQVDRYRFPARQGQQLVFAVRARDLIPYLADAVPGWFQATLALHDAAGNEVAYNDDYRFQPDPVLFCTIPRDGDYVLTIKDALFRGREDFVYRITVGELPFVTSIFPLGGRAGTQTTVKLEGWNLPQSTLVVDARNNRPGTLSLGVGSEGRQSNQVPFAVDTLPECLEQEPNNDHATAQRLTLPIIVNGRIDRPGDQDVFRFEGRAGQEIVAEVQARRLNSPLDSVLKLTDSTGRQLAYNDDQADKGSGLHTHHADSLLRFTLPADGTYYLHLGDAQRQGGSSHAYRLRISEPRPDFQLRVVPSTLNGRPGLCVPITVYALRRDGFTGEIALALKDAPQGFALSGARVPANQDSVRLTLTIPPNSRDEPCRINLEGRALIQGEEVCRPTVPAEDMEQAFYFHHLVPAQSLMVIAAGRGTGSTSLNLQVKEPVKLPAGGTASVHFSLPRGPFLKQLQLALKEPPDGITIQKVSLTGEGVTIALQADAAKVKPGLKGNLIVEAFMEGAPNARPSKPRMNRQRPSLGTLPAIPFDIVDN
jgi:hypothetical protein